MKRAKGKWMCSVKKVACNAKTERTLYHGYDYNTTPTTTSAEETLKRHPRGHKNLRNFNFFFAFE